jgi:hypothetical protein
MWDHCRAEGIEFPLPTIPAEAAKPVLEKFFGLAWRAHSEIARGGAMSFAFLGGKPYFIREVKVGKVEGLNETLTASLEAKLQQLSPPFEVTLNRKVVYLPIPSWVEGEVSSYAAEPSARALLYGMWVFADEAKDIVEEFKAQLEGILSTL